MTTKKRRTKPASIRTQNGRTIVTDAAGGEFDFRGETLEQLEATAAKLDADARWATAKAEYLRAAMRLMKTED